MNDSKTQTNSDPYAILEKSKTSPILIQNNLPQHKMDATECAPNPTIPDPNEKWSFLKSDLKSAMSDWTELEKKAPQKTPEEEQMEKVRSLISNLKDRLAEF